MNYRTIACLEETRACRQAQQAQSLRVLSRPPCDVAFASVRCLAFLSTSSTFEGPSRKGRRAITFCCSQPTPNSFPRCCGQGMVAALLACCGFTVPVVSRPVSRLPRSRYIRAVYRCAGPSHVEGEGDFVLWDYGGRRKNIRPSFQMLRARTRIIAQEHARQTFFKRACKKPRSWKILSVSLCDVPFASMHRFTSTSTFGSPSRGNCAATLLFPADPQLVSRVLWPWLRGCPGSREQRFRAVAVPSQPHPFLECHGQGMLRSASRVQGEGKATT